jgi:hypothetical protein
MDEDYISLGELIALYPEAQRATVRTTVRASIMQGSIPLQRLMIDRLGKSVVQDGFWASLSLNSFDDLLLAPLSQEAVRALVCLLSASSEDLSFWLTAPNVLVRPVEIKGGEWDRSGGALHPRAGFTFLFNVSDRAPGDRLAQDVWMDVRAGSEDGEIIGRFGKWPGLTVSGPYLKGDVAEDGNFAWPTVCAWGSFQPGLNDRHYYDGYSYVLVDRLAAMQALNREGFQAILTIEMKPVRGAARDETAKHKHPTDTALQKWWDDYVNANPERPNREENYQAANTHFNLLGSIVTHKMIKPLRQKAGWDEKRGRPRNK